MHSRAVYNGTHSFLRYENNMIEPFLVFILKHQKLVSQLKVISGHISLTLKIRYFLT